MLSHIQPIDVDLFVPISFIMSTIVLIGRKAHNLRKKDSNTAFYTK